jgi:hypothetical protein
MTRRAGPTNALGIKCLHVCSVASHHMLAQPRFWVCIAHPEPCQCEPNAPPMSLLQTPVKLFEFLVTNPMQVPMSFGRCPQRLLGTLILNFHFAKVPKDREHLHRSLHLHRLSSLHAGAGPCPAKQNRWSVVDLPSPCARVSRQPPASFREQNRKKA